MQGRQRWQSWMLTWLVLVLAVPALAQVVRGGEEGQPQPAARVQVTQNLTIAVCGDTCDCGSATQMSKESGPCTVRSPPRVVRLAAENVVCVPLPIRLPCVVTPVTAAPRACSPECQRPAT